MKNVFLVICIISLITLSVVGCGYKEGEEPIENKPSHEVIEEYVETYLSGTSNYIVELDSTKKIENNEYKFYTIYVFSETHAREFNYVVVRDLETNTTNIMEVRE